MSRKKVPRQIYLGAEQDEEIRALSKRLGIPQATLIREGVNRALAWRREKPDETVARVAVLIARGAHPKAPELAQDLAAELRTLLDIVQELRQETLEALAREAGGRAHLRQIAQGIAERLDDPLLSR